MPSLIPRQFRRDARDIGIAAGLGLEGTAEDGHRDSVPGRRCSYCRADGRLDMIDMIAMRAYFTCRRCGKTWDTERMAVAARQ